MSAPSEHARPERLRSERLWIGLLAVVSFLSGAAGGILVAPSLRRAPEPGPFAEYERLFVETFQPDAKRHQNLRFSLNTYRTQIEDLKARHLRQLEDDYVEKGRQCLQEIREYAVPPERFDDFDAWAGLDAPPLASASQ